MPDLPGGMVPDHLSHQRVLGPAVEHLLQKSPRTLSNQTLRLGNTQTKLYEVQDYLRKATNARTRPRGRKLNALDLPDGLLITVFGLVRGDSERDLHEAPYH